MVLLIYLQHQLLSCRKGASEALRLLFNDNRLALHVCDVHHAQLQRKTSNAYRTLVEIEDAFHIVRRYIDLILRH